MCYTTRMSVCTVHREVSPKSTSADGIAHAPTGVENQSGDSYDSVVLPPSMGHREGTPVANGAKSFLGALNALAEALRRTSGDERPVAQALMRLSDVCAGPGFDPLMGFSEEQISDYPFLSAVFTQEGLDKEYTPMSLILEGPTGVNARVTIDILNHLSELKDILDRPVYRNMQDSAAPYMSTNPLVVDWLLEQGANRIWQDGFVYESGINIAKLERKLFFLANAQRKTQVLREEVEHLFCAALSSGEKHSVKIANGQRIECDESRDVVAVLLDPFYLSDLPHDLVLSLLEIASHESFDFQAFGRDYGVHNLLYRACRDHCQPPHLKIIEFLLSVGLDPAEEIVLLDTSDGLVLEDDPAGVFDDDAERDDENEGNDGIEWSFSGRIPKSAALLIEDNISLTSSDPDTAEESREWVRIQRAFNKSR